MQQFVINIPDSQVDFLTELLTKLNISVEGKKTLTNDGIHIPAWQHELVLNRKMNTKQEDYLSEEDMFKFLESE